MVESVDLYISTIDSEIDNPNSFLVHPKRLPLLFTFKDSTFNSCVIEYTPIEYLTAINFAYILRILKADAQVKIIIYQPITVMQEYDSKQIEANAKLAGFMDFETGNDSFKNPKNGKPFSTISLSCLRPARIQKNIELELKNGSPKKINPSDTQKSSGQNKNLKVTNSGNVKDESSRRAVSSNVKIDEKKSRTKNR